MSDHFPLSWAEWKEGTENLYLLKEILEERLRSRQTDSPESIARRIQKAEKELKTAELFDVFILNETLDHACEKAEKIITEFLDKSNASS